MITTKNKIHDRINFFNLQLFTNFFSFSAVRVTKELDWKSIPAMMPPKRLKELSEKQTGDTTQ